MAKQDIAAFNSQHVTARDALFVHVLTGNVICSERNWV